MFVRREGRKQWQNKAMWRSEEGDKWAGNEERKSLTRGKSKEKMVKGREKKLSTKNEDVILFDFFYCNKLQFVFISPEKICVIGWDTFLGY